MFALSLGQAAAALAVTLVGFDLGLFDQAVVNAVVLMILCISILSPALGERYGREIARTIEQDTTVSDRPQRILLPVPADSQYREQLFSMALLLLEPGSTEPLYTVQVIEPNYDATDTERALAAAEADNQTLKEYAAGAEVSVDAETRVSYNIASGIAAAATDNRISTIVMGWDGSRSRRQQTFGSVIDGVLQQTRQLVVVARTQKPLNTTRRLVVILPPDCQYNDGFQEAVRSLKIAATEVGADIHAVSVGSETEAEWGGDGTEPDSIKATLEAIGPTVSITASRVDDWHALLSFLQTAVEPRDFVVCLSARRGEIGWHRELQTLPKSISTLVEGNFAIVYPSMTGSDDDRRFLKLRGE
jgi:nucleotide-binding universal stress UspA family protein